MIRQVETGAIYSEAIDIVPCEFTYEEADQVVQEEEIRDE